MKKLNILFLIAAIITLNACKKDLQLSTSKLSVNDATKAATFGMINWMGFINDDTSLSMLSVPGTHDSGATLEPLTGTAKNQNLSIPDQLNAGVRFLDIRCRHMNNSFRIYHSYVDQNLTFDQVLSSCYTFLNSNPTETIVMSIKEEYNSSNVTRSFEATFNSYIDQNPAKWNLTQSIPTVGSSRGKIVLLRRFSASTTAGIDASSWQDNKTFEMNTNSALIKVQDAYAVSNVDTKWTNIQNLLNEAKVDQSNRLYINFSSGYTSGLFGIPNIPSVSNNINPRIATFFTNNSGKYGIIPMDFVDSSRSKLIVEANF
ncbi:phosphatidylinositol-specific phospholipase C [Pedobacter sp. AW1-32]|uniref:phosphatidylinositol-specific phospholipase C n=1 Tax=Pedobacter sp. AW1-32 TaxID=3383026 RepID=UPI003FEEC6B0